MFRPHAWRRPTEQRAQRGARDARVRFAALTRPSIRRGALLHHGHLGDVPHHAHGAEHGHRGDRRGQAPQRTERDQAPICTSRRAAVPGPPTRSVDPAAPARRRRSRRRTPVIAAAYPRVARVQPPGDEQDEGGDQGAHTDVAQCCWPRTGPAVARSCHSTRTPSVMSGAGCSRRARRPLGAAGGREADQSGGRPGR